MSNHWIKLNNNARIDELLESFDFDKVKAVLSFMYPKQPCPDVDQLKSCARVLLFHVSKHYQGEYYEAGSSGFWASKNKQGTYMLKFSIDTWIQKKDEDFASHLDDMYYHQLAN